MTVRLFKVGWQGRALSGEAIVSVLQQVMEPIDTVQGNLVIGRTGVSRCWGTVVAYMCLWS